MKTQHSHKNAQTVTAASFAEAVSKYYGEGYPAADVKDNAGVLTIDDICGDSWSYNPESQEYTVLRAFGSDTRPSGVGVTLESAYESLQKAEREQDSSEDDDRDFNDEMTDDSEESQQSQLSDEQEEELIEEFLDELLSDNEPSTDSQPAKTHAHAK